MGNFTKQKTVQIHGFSTKDLSTGSDGLQFEFTIVNRMILTIDKSSHQVSIKSVLQNMIRWLLQCFNLNFNKSISQN